ncbi:VCBS repeat-containing protein [Dysgonomonas sp. 511]|uniref:FG-GAP repeat domain-containing protein n=1 Tax=Dysgonomonas sp. 511 TaxID=2302930 RepID=UPI0013D6C4E2|nr:VCBS repeat-containing protein [Dysgonomonas sp. 511]NDV79783.1 hypothetical protein [Dysgonomonas sp. 511]
MKKLYTLFLFLIIFVSVKAQENVIDEDSLQIADYVNYRPADVNPIQNQIDTSSINQKSFSINSRNTTNIIIDVKSPNFDDSKDVGDIPLQYGLSPSGGVTYKIPIQTISSPDNFQPDISLLYNSQSGDGIAGWGWSLGGLSSITKTGKSLYYDWAIEPLKISGYNYCLDNLRLIGDHSYQTIHNNIKVIKLDSKTFKAYYPNGSIAFFSSPDSEEVLSFPITSFEDIKGNKISYSYIYSNRNYYISEITYGRATDPIAKIRFTYKNNEKSIASYVDGYSFKLEKVLSKVEVFYRNSATPSRCYDLTYSDDPKSNYLTKVDCSAGNSSLNPLIFTYGSVGDGIDYLEQQPAYLQRYWPNAQSVEPGWNNLNLIRAKFQLNGSDGLIVYPDIEKYGWLTKNKDTGKIVRYGSQFGEATELLVFDNIKSNSFNTSVSILAGSGFQSLSPVDINGDGVDKLVKVNYNINGASTDNEVMISVYRPNSATPYSRKTISFNDGSSGIVTDQGYKSTLPRTFLYGDFDGDGLTDLMAISSSLDHKKDYRVSKITLFNLRELKAFYNGNDFDYETQHKEDLSYIRNSDNIFPVDYDGDGKTDICLINKTGIHVPVVH